MLCYAMLCYAMLCYAMLCVASLCYAMLCYCNTTTNTHINTDTALYAVGHLLFGVVDEIEPRAVQLVAELQTRARRAVLRLPRHVSQAMGGPLLRAGEALVEPVDGVAAVVPHGAVAAVHPGELLDDMLCYDMILPDII